MLIVVLITGFFLIPVLILLYVQLGNYCAGKTMLERYSRGANNQDDVMQKLINSGIRNDSRILQLLIDQNKRSTYNDSLMMANKDMSDKMMMNQLGVNTPDRVPYKNNFCSMVCQNTIRPQDEIYEAHLEQ